MLKDIIKKRKAKRELTRRVKDLVNAKSFVLFASKLHSGGVSGDELIHYFTVGEGFKTDDVDICLNSYRQLADEFLAYMKKKNEFNEALDEESGDLSDEKAENDKRGVDGSKGAPRG